MPPLPLLLLLPPLLLLAALAPAAHAADPTLPPKRPPGTPRQETDFVNPISKPTLNGSKEVHIIKYAQIPDFVSPNTGLSRPSRLTGLTYYGRDLYVTTSTSGAYIYRVFPNGFSYLWANIQRVVLRDTGRNVNCETAQHGGLRGVAFPPDHDKTGLFYVSYMEDRPEYPGNFTYLSRPEKEKPVVADSVVVEFKYDWTTNRIVKGSYRTVIRIGLTSKDHPIKQITFQGKFLLIGHGDGAVGSNPSPGGMNNDGLGKILRINPRKGWDGKPYRIPSSNPWVGKKQYMDELFAIGFRNPHNICYSRKNGIFVADVGRDNIEEVNIVKKGGNYGWGEREGTFVNLYDGGTLTGIGPLPANDAKNGYIYPAVQVGHYQPEGGKIRWGLAIAGSCPIETDSDLYGLYFYANFGERGELFYSWVREMKTAVTSGSPEELTQATVYRARKMLFYKDGMDKPPVKVESLVELVNADGSKSRRVDARFGRGPRGEIYITSKVTGAIYQIRNTLPKSG